MKELINDFDHDIHFSDLAKAKKYYYPSEEMDCEVKNPENFLGQPEEFREFLEHWEEYKSGILSSETLEALADALNKRTDVFGNGSIYRIKEN